MFSGQDLDFLNQHGSGSSTVSHLGSYFLSESSTVSHLRCHFFFIDNNYKNIVYTIDLEEGKGKVFVFVRTVEAFISFVIVYGTTNS